MTYIKMKFILGVTLLVVQLSSTRAGIASATADIVTYINGENFNKAFKEAGKLKEEDLQTVMNAVIRDVYRNDFRNIDLILKFVNSKPTERKVSFAVYKALNNQLQSDVDHLYRLKIMKSFNSKPFNLEEEKAMRLKNKLHNSVSNVVVEDLKNALKNKNSQKVSTLCEDINTYYPKSFNKVIRKVSNEAFDEIDTPYLVQFFVNHKNPSQSMSAYLAAFNNLKEKNRLDESVLVTLASGVKEALDKSPDSQTRERGEKLRDELPLSVKNIAFSNSIYIVNQNGEYLYAASDGFITDSSKQRRPIFTWTPKERISQGVWGIERQADFTYQIKNIRSSTHSEYLLRSLIPTADDYSYVYTWVPGGTDDYAPGQYNWVFEPSGDYVYIRNKYRKEYLYVTNEYEGIDRRDRRIVYTHRSGNKVDGSLWKIEPYFDIYLSIID